MVVSGSFSDCAKVVNGVMLSPRPWRRRRMFGGVDWDCGEDESGGGVIVMVRCEGKSEGVGDPVGIVAVWVLFCALCEMNWLSVDIERFRKSIRS